MQTGNVNLADIHTVRKTLRHRGTQRLPQDGTGRHDARGAEGGVGDADVSSRKNQITDILGDHATQRQAPGTGRRMPNGGATVWIVKALGKMIVHRPSRIGDKVLKAAFRLHIVLGDGVFAHVATTFTLAGQKADPLQLPVVGTVVAVVLDMIPYAVGDLDQLLAAGVGIVNAIPHASNLDPPEIVPQIVGAIGKVIVGGIAVRPIGRDKFHLVIGLTDLKQTTHAHGLLIGNVGRDRLPKLGLCLTSVAELGTRERG